jgi:hypothetical protein
MGEDGLALQGCPLLGQVANSQILGSGYTTGIGLRFSHEDMQESGLPGSIGSHEPDSVTWTNVKRDPLEKVLLPEKLACSLNCDH